MIKIFKGKWRGINVQDDSGFGLILDFKFRGIIQQFKGARLHVFLAIALHADENGRARPSYELLEKETGYQSSTIGTALAELCDLVIEGQRILVRYREKDARGQFVGGNQYIIFPTPADLENPDLDFPEVDFSRSGKIAVEVNPVIKDYPNICFFCHAPAAEMEMTQYAGTQVPRCEDCSILGVTEPQLERRVRRTAEEVKASLGETLDRVMTGKISELPDFADYPEGLRPVLKSVVTLFGVEPGSSKGAKAHWIEGGRELQEACGEFGSAVLWAFRAQFLEKTIKAGGIPPFDIKSPRSLVTSAASIARGFRDAGKTSLDKAALIDEYEEKVAYLQSARSRTDAPEGV